MLLPAALLGVMAVLIASVLTQSGMGRVTSTGVAAVVFGFIRASEVSWADPVTIASLAVGASTLTAFAIRQRRTSHPLLPPRLVNSARRAAVAAALPPASA